MHSGAWKHTWHYVVIITCGGNGGTYLITTGPTSGFGRPMAGEGKACERKERRRVEEAAPIKLSLLVEVDGWLGLD